MIIEGNISLYKEMNNDKNFKMNISMKNAGFLILIALKMND